jgi:hypothetical protein
MSNARVFLEMRAEGQLVSNGRGDMNGPTMQENAEDGSFQRVLDPDRNPRTMVVIIHEEAINQSPGMAYYGGRFSGGGGSECEGNRLHTKESISSEGHCRCGRILEAKGVFFFQWCI